MRLLITGGAGFIGSHVAEHAVEAGFDVAVLDNLSTGKLSNLPAGVRFYHADLRDREAVQAALLDFRPDTVSHQAAQASVGHSIRDPLSDAEINVLGTLHLLEACRTADVRRVVFASTGGAIYGEVRAPRKASPRWPARPESPYATAKLAGEAYLHTYGVQYGLDHVILRYANVYGPRQNPHGEAGVVAIFCQALLAGDPLRIYGMRAEGDEGCVRDYVHVHDVARANVSAALGRPLPTVLNVGTGRACTTKALVRALQRTVGREVRIDTSPPRQGDLQRSVLDVTDFIAHFGSPVRLGVGLADTLRSFGLAGVTARPLSPARTRPTTLTASPGLAASTDSAREYASD